MAPRLTQTTSTFHQHFSNISRIVGAALLAAALTGCITNQPTYLQHAPRPHHVTYRDAIFSMGDCHRRAAELCSPNRPRRSACAEQAGMAADCEAETGRLQRGPQ
jgi:hypothetical protein